MADPEKQNKHLVAEAIPPTKRRVMNLTIRFNEYFDGDEHIEIRTLSYREAKSCFGFMVGVCR